MLPKQSKILMRLIKYFYFVPRPYEEAFEERPKKWTTTTNNTPNFTHTICHENTPPQKNKNNKKQKKETPQA